MNLDCNFILDNMRIWKETCLAEDANSIAKMTENEKRAYYMGINNLYNFFSSIVKRNYEEGYYTVLCSKFDDVPTEYSLGDFLEWNYHLNNEE